MRLCDFGLLSYADAFVFWCAFSGGCVVGGADSVVVCAYVSCLGRSLYLFYCVLLGGALAVAGFRIWVFLSVWFCVWMLCCLWCLGFAVRHGWFCWWIGCLVGVGTWLVAWCCGVDGNFWISVFVGLTDRFVGRCGL